MKFFIVLFLSTACTTSSQQVPGSVKFLEQDAKIRRQTSYTTNVIHQNAKYPDQRAESSINVDFRPQKPKQPRQPPNQPKPAYQTYNNQQYRRPKAVQAYSHSHLQMLQPKAQPQYGVDEKTPQATQYHPTIQSATHHGSPQSQSFNVGYSVMFTGNSKPQTPRAFTRQTQRLENAEIITGARKEAVQKPSSEFDANDFVNNALIDLKKQKVSGIKPKLHKFPTNKDNDAKSFIGNLAPKTQQYLSYLGDAKPIGSSNIRFRQQLQTDSVQSPQVVSGAWTNLSPSVEIYHSKELPSHVFNPKEQRDQSNKFDHVGALGKSQGFDYTNALEAETDQAMKIFAQQYQELAGNSVEKRPQSLLQPYPDFTRNLDAATNHLMYPYANSFDSVPVVGLNNLQVPQKTEDLQGFSPQLPLQQQNPSGHPKFAMDTSLLRDPVLLESGKNAPSDTHTLTIPFDTTLLQAMQQKLLASSQTGESFGAGKGQAQLLQGNVGVAGQPFQGQIENLQAQPLQGIKQDGYQSQGYQEFQGQQAQQTQQFNVYGSPQQALFLNNGFDKYFDQTFEKLQSQESRYEGAATLRPPKLNNINNYNNSNNNIYSSNSNSNSYTNNNNNNNRLRTTKELGLSTNLRPPPMQIGRHRRMFTG